MYHYLVRLVTLVLMMEAATALMAAIWLLVLLLSRMYGGS
jgi:hypothetical protein